MSQTRNPSGGTMGGGGGSAPTWGNITGSIGNQSDLQTALSAKAAANHGHAWGDLSGTLSDQTDLQAEFDAKAEADHAHVWGDVGGTLSDQTDLQAALDAKAAAVHSHAWGSVTGTLSNQADLQAALDAKAASGHSHAWGSITGTLSNQTDLQTALDGKAATGHNHDASYEALGAVAAHVAAGDPHAGYQLESQKGSANGYASLDGNTRVPLAQLGSGSPSGSNFLRGDGSWATPAGGGGVSPLIVNLIADAAGVTWTNMPAAVTFFSGSHRFAIKIDLTGYTQVRLIVNKQGTAGAAASVVRLRYRTAFDTTVGNWLTIGASEVQVAVNVQNTVIASAWINLVAGAQGDVFITLDGSGGDGVLDPAFGSIVAQFK